MPQLGKLIIHDSDRNVRYWSGALLEHIKGGGAVPQLILALNDKDRGVRSCATRALGAIGSKDAAQPIIAAIKAKRVGAYEGSRALAGDKDEKVRANLAAAIHSLDPQDPYPKQALPDLIEIARKGEWLNQMDAIHALGALGDLRAAQVLLELLKHDNFTVRRDSALALASLGYKEAVPAIRKLLDDDEDQVVDAAIEALRKLESGVGTGNWRFRVRELARLPMRDLIQKQKPVPRGNGL